MKTVKFPIDIESIEQRLDKICKKYNQSAKRLISNSRNDVEKIFVLLDSDNEKTAIFQAEIRKEFSKFFDVLFCRLT